MRFPRKLAKGGLYAGVALFALALGAYLWVHSEGAKEKAKAYLTELISRSSGGRAEIAALDYDLGTLSGELRGFVLHGQESAAEAPLFRAERIHVDATVLSWFGRPVLGETARVDLVSVKRPEINIHLYEDGTNNFPKPPGPSSGEPLLAPLIRLAIGTLTIQDGTLSVAQQSVPLDVSAEDLDVSLKFERLAQRYVGTFSAKRMQFSTDSLEPVPFDLSTGLILEPNRALLEGGKIRYRESGADFSLVVGDFRDFKIDVDFDATIRVADFHREYSLPVEARGRVLSKGRFTYTDKVWRLQGEANGNGLAWRSGAVRVDDIRLRSDLDLQSGAFVFRNLAINALGGDVVGEARLRSGAQFELESKLRNLSLARVSRASGIGVVGFDTLLSGSLAAKTEFARGGVRGSVVTADLTLNELDGPNPVNGIVRATFDQRGNTITFGETHLTLANSALDVNGDIRSGLSVDLNISRFEDFVPALALFSESPEALIPVKLGPGGNAGFKGVVSGEWMRPLVAGSLRAKNVVYEGRTLESATAVAELSPDGLTVTQLRAKQGNVEMRGDLRLSLSEWKPTDGSALQATATAKGPNLDTVLREAGQQSLPLNGTPDLKLELSGSVGAPVARVEGTLTNGSAWDTAFESFELRAAYSANEAKVERARLVRGKATLDLTGSYQHAENDYERGTGSLLLRLTGLKLEEIAEAGDQRINADATIEGQYQIAFRVAGKEFQLESVDGSIDVAGIAYEGKPAGQLRLTTKTSSGTAAVLLSGNLAGSAVRGDATIGLREGYPSAGKVAVGELTLASLRRWLPAAMNERNLPLRASLLANATFEGSLADPAKLRAELTVERLRLATVPATSLTLTARNSFEMTNLRPMRLRWTGQKLEAIDVALEGTGTKLTVAGSVTPGSARQQMDLRARGSLNFNIFNAFEPTLDAGGLSELDLTIRGTFKNPDVYGLLDMKEASLYLAGVPNGLDKINGKVFLYRDRANIEEITAESGGGTVKLSGFVSYNDGVPTFRVSAVGNEIRVRYPPGVSTSANATLELTGSRNRSILSGNVAITRIALNPRSDLGSILQNTSRPIATPSANQNEFLRNMRFDVRVQTAADVRFDTSLTQDLSGEADLRLRGNPYSPVLLGDVTVTQGEINFFGNKYFIDRGEIAFLNPLKLEPVLNLDLRTRVRSIDVTLTFSGPLDKLNVNYRSDPPLQLNEIIALLTVGRAPASSPSLADAQSEAAQSWQQIGASALVGQAVAAPLAGRLQKFFGVSRIKIDPRLTGVENNPQARLTVEQQVNRDITVTFITNLADAQQQVVRLEWNFNPAWSMVALRDEDGLFGIDFLYRKRF